MSANILRSQYSDLYGSAMLPVLEEIFKGELDQYPSLREQLFKVVDTDRDIWQATELHDMELFTQIAEGGEYSYKRPKQGSSKTLSINKFGLGFAITEEVVADGKFSLIADMTKMLAESARESQEVQAMSVFNNGFSGSTELAADGQNIFDTDHGLPSGGTFRNKLSSNSDLSASSLEQMLLDFETQFVGDSGIIKRIKPRKLFVPMALKRYALELVGSELKPDSADNNMNSLKGEGLQVVASPHLTDSDAWFILGDSNKTGLRIVRRTGIETKAAGPDAGFDTDSMKYKSRYREKIGVTHAYGIFGTPGA
jgi:hypothetical protein